jgi:hypothetical protein
MFMISDSAAPEQESLAAAPIAPTHPWDVAEDVIADRIMARW